MTAKGTAEPPKYLGYGRQTIDDEDVAAVVAALRGDFLTQGPAVVAFERALAQYTGARHAVAVSSGTAALHIACLAAGAGPGVLGLTQPLTFVASANCLAYCGAAVDLVEVDPSTLMMDTAALAKAIDRRPETKIVIPVSMTGLSSGIRDIKRIAGPGRIVIEDASHTLGGDREDGAKVGGPGGADMTVFSFHPVKPVTTAEGGAVVTDDDELARRLRIYRSHGIARSPDPLESPENNLGPWYYEQQVLGYNYRLTDLQAALGVAQLRRIDSFIARRRQIADAYDRRFAGKAHVRPLLSEAASRRRSGHHLYVVDIDYAAAGHARGEVMTRLHAAAIGTQVHYIPVHMQPYWRHRLEGADDRFPVSDRYYRGCLTLPCFPGMSDADVDRVVSSLEAILMSNEPHRQG